MTKKREVQGLTEGEVPRGTRIYPQTLKWRQEVDLVEKGTMLMGGK